MKTLLTKILQCEVCKNYLPSGPRPVVQLNPFSKIIIIGQAPGRRVHETGIPWNDASGKKLREWMDINETTFYNDAFISLMPMGFCYPGKGNQGDLPPRKECAPLWHPQILQKINTKPLILLVGQYAQRYYLKNTFYNTLTETVKNYASFLPDYFPLPHPSPRNQHWVRENPWFLKETIPQLQKTIKEVINKENVQVKKI